MRLADGDEVIGRAVVMATGHSARDVHELLARAGVRLEAKPFALGVRIEHPQPLIDRIQYGRAAGHPKLPAAAYRLAFTPSDGRGVFSFCMCPGGLIVPASTEPDGVVVNGMSLSRRDSPFANSGLVVVGRARGSRRATARVERRSPASSCSARSSSAAAAAGGGELRAPATRATDFVAARRRRPCRASSYQPGLAATDVAAVLDATGLPLAARLREALAQFDRQMRGYLTDEAVLVGVESRTTSPVRVPRDRRALESPDLARLYPAARARATRAASSRPRSTASGSRARSRREPSAARSADALDALADADPRLPAEERARRGRSRSAGARARTAGGTARSDSACFERAERELAELAEREHDRPRHPHHALAAAGERRARRPGSGARGR